MPEWETEKIGYRIFCLCTAIVMCAAAAFSAACAQFSEPLESKMMRLYICLKICRLSRWSKILIPLANGDERFFAGGARCFACSFLYKDPTQGSPGVGSNALRKALAVFTKEQYITYMPPLFSALTACFPFTFRPIEGIICSNTQGG